MVCPPLCSGDMGSTLLCSQYPSFFAPSSSEMAVGCFFCLCIFWSRIRSNCACTQLILVPYSFFVFCSSRRGMSSCKFCSPAAKGSRTQPASKRLMQPTETLLAPAFLEYGMMGVGRGWGHCRRRSFHHYISNI